MEKSAAEIISMLQSLHAKIDVLPTSPARYGGVQIPSPTGLRINKSMEEAYVKELYQVQLSKIVLYQRLRELYEMLKTLQDAPTTKENLSKRDTLEKERDAAQSQLSELAIQEMALRLNIQRLEG